MMSLAFGLKNRIYPCAAFLAKRSVAVFLLSLISKHGMLRVGLM